MTAASDVEGVLEMYRRHGWQPRRALLTEASAERLGYLFPAIEIKNAPFDAVWFSRRSVPDREVWELRRLSAPAFAILEIIDDGDEPAEIAERLAEAEERMASSALN